MTLQRRLALPALWIGVYLVCAVSWWLLTSWRWPDPIAVLSVVPDAISLDAVLSEPHSDLLTLSVPSQRATWTFASLYSIHPYLVNLLNLVLLCGTVWVTCHASEIVGGKLMAHLAGAIMALNPLLWILCLGPTKEPAALMATATTALIVVLPSGLSLCLGLLCITILIPLRLEQAFTLVCSLVLIALARRSSYPRHWLIAATSIASVGSIFLYSMLRLITTRPLDHFSAQLQDPLANRTLEAATSIGDWGVKLGSLGWDSPMWNVVAFAYRIAANLLGCLFRMGVFRDDGGIAILGIGFAMAGFLTATGMLTILIRAVRRNSPHSVLLAIPIMLLWIAASSVPFVQPRYLLPALPIAVIGIAALNHRDGLRVILAMLAMLLVGRLLFWTAGHGIPPWRVTEPARPSFLYRFRDKVMEQSPDPIARSSSLTLEQGESRV